MEKNSLFQGFSIGGIKPLPTFHADLNPSISPIKILEPEGLNQIKEQLISLTKGGMAAISTEVAALLPKDSTALLSLSETTAKGLSVPTTQATLLQILFDTYFGSGFSERLLWARIYLTICKNESGFNPLAKSTTSTASGQLQVINASKQSFRTIGAGLVQSHVGLSLALKMYAQAHPKDGYVDQVLINIGAMASLRRTINEEWAWNNTQGWIPSVAISSNPLTREIQKRYSAILKSYDLGCQFLASLYHINGLHTLDTLGVELRHQSRLMTDVLDHYKLGRVPGLTIKLLQTLPGKLAKLLTPTAMGDVEEIGWIGPPEDITTNYNDFLGALLDIPYALHAAGTGIITSAYGKVRTLTDASTGVTSTHAHKGTDLGAVTGQPVFAVSDGVVSRAFDAGDSNYGKTLEITNVVGGYKEIYGHNSSLIVDKDAQVKKGDIIALAGSTGFSTAPHVHYEVRTLKNVAVKPSKFSLDPVWSVNKRAT